MNVGSIHLGDTLSSTAIAHYIGCLTPNALDLSVSALAIRVCELPTELSSPA